MNRINRRGFAGVFHPMLISSGSLYRVTAKGCLVGLLWAFAALGQTEQPAQPIDQPAAQKAQADTLLPAPDIEEPAPQEIKRVPYRPDCERPNDHDEADLCQQRSMAQAATDQLYWITLQFWATLASIGGLIATLLFTAKATLAAERAVIASERSVEVAQDTAQRQLRAYLAMEPKSVGGFLAGGAVRIEFFPNNHGQTPASGVSHIFDIGIFPDPLPADFELPTPTREVRTEFTIFPDSEQISWFVGKPFTQDDVDLVRAGKARLYCWGTTFYSDVFRKERKVRFCMSVHGLNFVDAQAAYHAGVRSGLPEWQWEFGAGHGDTD